MSAEVKPENLRAALNAKIGTAVGLMYELGECDKPRINRHWEPRDRVINFLHAATGVFPVAGKFGANHLPPGGFTKWLEAWQNALSPSDRDLWLQMRTERVSQEHGEGVDLVDIQIPITEGEMPVAPHNIALLGLAPYKNECSKGGVRFAAYPGRPMSDVCADFLTLAQLFVDDFLRDHAHLIP